jgi:hypothetical protein
MHWAAEMGLRLLQERHACREAAVAAGGGSSSSASSGSGVSDATRRCWGTWIECLPPRVVTPLEFTPEQVQRCGVPSTIKARRPRQGAGSGAQQQWQQHRPTPPRPYPPIVPAPARPRATHVTVQDILSTQAALRECYDELRPALAAIGSGWDDLLWAAQVLHSRCFYDAGLGLHLSVPGGCASIAAEGA